MFPAANINAGAVQALALYNQWMNQKLYAKAATLPEASYKEDKGAFFGSIHATFNHIMVADAIWLTRLAKQRAYQALKGISANVAGLDYELYGDLKTLGAQREALDQTIIQWSQEISDADLMGDLVYKDTKMNQHTTPMSLVVLHLFNHQTHHRGQITTLFSQMGLDVGVTDFVALARENLAQ